MVLNILQQDDPFLRKKCIELTPDIDIKEIIENMIDTLKETKYGVGLSAPQIGCEYRFFIIKDEHNNYEIFINPEIIESSTQKYKILEGCLSVENIEKEIERPEQIKATWKDLEFNTYTKTLDLYTSRVFQHELDHLNGILFIDYP